MTTQIVPVVIGALGVVMKGIEKLIGSIPWSIDIAELQIIALLASAHILRKNCQWRRGKDNGSPLEPKNLGLDPVIVVKLHKQPRNFRDNNTNNLIT